MGRRRSLEVAAGLAALALAALGVTQLLGGARDRQLAPGRWGGTVARAIAAATRSDWRRPARCVGSGAEVPELVLAGDRTYRRDRGRLAGGNPDGRVAIGFVADARGGGRDHLDAAKRAFAAAKVDAVIALGGMGTTRDEIVAALQPLVDGPWIVAAMPGDREAAHAHAAAIEQLVAAGAPIVDGAAARVIVIDGVAIGFLPGLAVDREGRAHGLVAGVAGCGRTDDDTDAVAQALAAEAQPKILASYAPPRQRGADATDLTAGGVHVGEPSVARALEQSGAGLVVHAQIDETGGRAAPGAVSCGALDDAPRTWQEAAIGVIVEVSPAGAPRIRPLSATHTRSGAR